MTISVDQGQTAPIAASDPVLNCLLIECHIIIRIKK